MIQNAVLACLFLSAVACGEPAKGPSSAGKPAQNGDDDGDGSGNGEGNGNSSGDGDPASGGDGGYICEEQVVRNDRLTPDMLIVLDRSGSMKDEDENRWDPSVSGLNAITGTLDSAIRFGLMTFPGRGAAGDDENECAPGQLDAPLALDNAETIASLLAGMQPDGRTPTAATLEVALEELGRLDDDPDRPPAPKYVLLVTDGSPNCMGGNGGREGAVDATVAAIEALAAAGIPTYVLGYDTQNDPELSAALDRMAVAGNTGDQAHRPIEDEASLVHEFESIAGAAVTCEYALDQAVSDASYVRVELDGVPIPHGQSDGWVLGSDAKHVTLQGEPCDRLRNGGEHLLSVVVQCTQVIL